jgi:uncharacterized damage-inducible protein DinB
MDARHLLLDTVVHLPPPRVLEQLETADAERRLPGASHTIAEIVAHLSFWQDWFYRRCNGAPEPMPAVAADGWPEVAAGSWPDLQARFVGGLERAASLASRAGQPIAPAIEFPPLAGYAVGDAIVHMAQHNSHHLGQVVLITQLMGLWPPPSGGWTW